MLDRRIIWGKRSFSSNMVSMREGNSTCQVIELGALLSDIKLDFTGLLLYESRKLHSATYFLPSRTSTTFFGCIE